LSSVATTGTMRNGAVKTASPVPWRLVAAAAVVVLAFVALFFRWFLQQDRFSRGQMEDWGHAYIIPLISGYMLWLKRDELRAAPRAVFWPGLSVMLCGIGSYFFFLVGVSNHLGQGLALILTLAGLVILLLGPEVFRLSFVAIAYLLFAITLPEQVMNLITFQLKLFASAGAGVALTLLAPIWGYAITVEGNIIEIIYKGVPIPLNVADACSGMRMVVAFFALGAAVAIFACKHWWQRVALLLMAAPVAIFMNVVRVTVLGIASLYSADLAKGDAHMLIGTLLLVPGLALFLSVVWILNKVVVDSAAAGESTTVPAPAKLGRTGPPLPNGEPRSRAAAIVVAAALMLTAAASVSASIAYFKIYLQKRPIQPETSLTLLSIPKETASWVQLGIDRAESAEVLEVLGTENYLTRTYARKDAPHVRVMLHCAYYTGMIDTVPHVPDRCFVGAGMEIGEVVGDLPLMLDRSRWSVDEDVPPNVLARHDPSSSGTVFYKTRLSEYSSKVGLYPRLPRSPADIRMRTMKFLRADGDPLYSGYFFIANGGTVSRAEGVRLLAFNLDDFYAYYLKVQFTGEGMESGEELADVATQLLDELFPDIMLCVPDWVQVESGAYPADNPMKSLSGSSIE